MPFVKLMYSFSTNQIQRAAYVGDELLWFIQKGGDVNLNPASEKQISGC